MVNEEDEKNVKTLKQPITLPCGLTLKNRIVKAAMEPCLAIRGRPSDQHLNLHSKWSKGGFGLLISENVQVSSEQLATPHDLFILPEDEISIPDSLRAWSDSTRDLPTIVQLSHPGIQSCRGCGRLVWKNSVGPSPLRVRLGDRIFERILAWALFNRVSELSKVQIKGIVQRFLSSAKVVHLAGFKGVQLHCSHGYLLAQFLSPKTNLRKDEYGSNNFNRLRILFEIIESIRSNLPETFCLAVKLNSGDYVKGGLTEEDALDYVRLIVEHGGVDLIEISGGTYENVAFMNETLRDSKNVESLKTSKKSSQSEREAFFIDFSNSAKRVAKESSIKSSNPCPIIITTGGFRSRSVMAQSIIKDKTDLIGLGRPACIDPDIANKFLNESLVDFKFSDPIIPGTRLWKILIPVKLIGIGFTTVWYTWQMQRISNNKPIRLNYNSFLALNALLPLNSIIKITFITLIVLIGLIFKFYI